jgi:hypothetical protein
MILNTKKVFHEESGWEKIENRVRTWVHFPDFLFLTCLDLYTDA